MFFSYPHVPRTDSEGGERMKFPAASLGKHCSHRDFLYALPTTQVSLLGFERPHCVCASTARDHFSLLPAAEEFVQQHLGCSGETAGKGWLGAVHQAG